MMNTYKISFEKIRQNQAISPMLDALERGFQKFGLEYYLIGATAQNAWLSGIHGETPGRVTRDLDLAVLVPDRKVYADLRSYLIDVENFHPQGDNWHKLIWQEKMEVDILPFSEMDDEDQTIYSDGSGYLSANFPGLKEIFYAGLPLLKVEDKHEFKFCTIPGIVLLKLFAWHDDPDRRSTDIEDIADMILHYFNMSSDNIYEGHLDLFGDEEFHPKKVGTRVIGREIAKILKKSPDVLVQLLVILEKQTQDVNTSVISDLMARHYENTVEENLELLNLLRIGLSE